MVEAAQRLNTLLHDKRTSFVTMGEAAEILQRSRRHTWHLVTEGAIGPAVQVVREWLVPRAAVEAHAAGHSLTQRRRHADDVVEEVAKILAEFGDQFMTITEVAEELGISPRRAGYLVNRKVIGPAILVGREWVVPRKAVSRDKLRPSGRSAHGMVPEERAKYLTIPQVARLWGISRQQVWSQVQQGQLGERVGSVYVRPGGVWLIPRAAVEMAGTEQGRILSAHANAITAVAAD